MPLSLTLFEILRACFELIIIFIKVDFRKFKNYNLSYISLKIFKSIKKKVENIIK